MRRIDRIYLSMAHDAVMAFAAPWLALYLRVGQDIGDYDPQQTAFNAVLFCVVTVVALRLFGLYRGVWRYASTNDMFAILKAATLSVLVFTLLAFQINRLTNAPRSTLAIEWLALIMMLAGPRIAYRLFKDRRLDRLFEHDLADRTPVLLIGAGDGTETFIREMRRDREGSYHPVGIVGMTDSRVGREIHGVPVLGTLDELPGLLKRFDGTLRAPRRLIVTQEDIPGDRLTVLVDEAAALGLDVARMPRVGDLKLGIADQAAVRPIAIEDLLQRPQRVLDHAGMARLVAGRRVLVTGAGGTIGSELVRQIAALAPESLTLVEISEYQLYLVDLEIGESYPKLPRRPYLGDVRDRRRLDEILAEAKPELVFHAAAYKHVPMVEANPVEGVLTNVIGTRNVALACAAHHVATMVLISTDKAVHPANVMGATKRLAEAVCQSLDRAALASGDEGATRYITVRFGNVLDSTGSVVPLFRRQIAAGGPVTVTHPEVRRYFMTVREAVELVLQAASLATSGVSPADLGQGGIFVLEMGDPVLIADLARRMIRLAGPHDGHRIEIAYVGLRPGEKLNEELFHEAEPAMPTSRPGLLLARPRVGDYAVLARALGELEEAARQRDEPRTLGLLRRLVPEFQPADINPSQPAAAEG